MLSNYYKAILFFVIGIGVFHSCSDDSERFYTVSGTVLYEDVGMSGVTITCTGGVMVTDEAGKYSFSAAENSTITITPSADGYAFDPPSIEIVMIASNTASRDFEASRVYDVSVDFQQVDLPDAGYISNLGAGLEGVFTEGIVSFPNYFNEGFQSWSGFACSMMSDVTTTGIDNQYSVYIPDNADNKFMVVFAADPVDFSSRVSLTFSQPVEELSFDVTNTTYAALTMKNGDSFAKKFTASDWFELSVVAVTAAGVRSEPVTFRLANGTSIVDKWHQIQVPHDGGIVELEFSLSSTDVGDWGMNTPAYFAIDNIRAMLVK